MEPLTPYLEWWRHTTLGDREIVDALVRPEHRDSPEFQRELRQWPGAHYWSHGDGDGRIVLIRPVGKHRRERWWLHAALFLITFVTVWMGGALLAGSEAALVSPFTLRMEGAGEVLRQLGRDLGTLKPGLDFAMALMAILLAHETGHYIVARRYGIDASPPYFLPAPPFMNVVGTFGAFIRLRSPIVDRRQLLDVGAAGPWAGFIVAMVALGVGLQRSEVTMAVGPSKQFVEVASMRLFIGDSPLMLWAREFAFGDATVLLHPLAFAGWLGLFVTMLNLLPLGQLDGGHILYALVARFQRVVGFFVFMGLIALGTQPGQKWWWIWAIIILLMGRGRIAHPNVLDRHRPLPRNRWPYGLATVALFVLTFTPIPIVLRPV